MICFFAILNSGQVLVKTHGNRTCFSIADLVILIMSGLARERHLKLELPSNIICCVRRDFILNFRRTAGLESISDEIQIHAFLILGTYYVAQWALAMSLCQPNVYYLS